MDPKTALTLTSVALALAACNPADTNRTTAAPPGVKSLAALAEPPVTPSAPTAPAERGPIPSSANAAAPGTDATVALTRDASSGNPGSTTASPDTGARAQDAAAKAPDTAAGDAAKTQAQAERDKGGRQ